MRDVFHVKQGSLAVIAAVSLQWSMPPGSLPQDRFVVERSRDAAFVEIDTVFVGPDSSFVDYIEPEQRFFYRVRTVRPRAGGGELVSAPSAVASALYVDFSEGYADTMQWRAHAGGDHRTLLVVGLPAGKWRVSWALRMLQIGAPAWEWCEPWCLWDLNRNKRLELSDLVGVQDGFENDPEGEQEFGVLYGRLLNFWFQGGW